MVERSRPLIGVTGHCTTTATGVRMVTAKHAYLAAVSAAGGVPVVLSPDDDPVEIVTLLGRVDGILFTGGKDIDPILYGEPVLNDTVQPEPERDAFELPLIREAVSRDVPVLAICRGCQVLNVSLGGTLWQDLPAQRPGVLAHQQHAPRDATSHSVTVDPDSLLARVLGAGGPLTIETNTFHHQAARDPAPLLRPVAAAPDGTLEALEAPGRRFVLGVQWHPEDLALQRPEHLRIFEAFVDAARRH